MDLEINCRIPDLPRNLWFPDECGLPSYKTYEEYFALIIQELDEKGNFGKTGDGRPSTQSDVDIDYINGNSEVRNTTSSNDGLSQEDENFQESLRQEIKEAKESKGQGKGNSTNKLILKPKKPLDILHYIRTRCSNIRNQQTFGYDEINYNAIRNTTIPRIIEFKTYSELVIIKLAFIVDVSGSRSDEQINDSISRIWSMMETVDDTEFIIDLYFADDGVTQINRVLYKRDIPKTYVGRGGTELAKVCKEFKEDYDLIVILTDGFIDWPEVNTLEKKFFEKAVIGIDSHSYLQTCNHSKLPTFVL